MTPCEARVQGVLLGNAAFSLASAIALIFAGATFADFLHPDLPVWLVRATGGGLALFAIGVIWISQAPRLRQRQVCLVILADLSWVCLSIIALAIWGAEMSAMSVVLVAMVALIVALFAVLQTGGLLKARRQESASVV